MPVWWTFRCYRDERGIDVIDDWYASHPEKLQAKFDTRIRYLQQQPRANWIRPYYDTLGNDCAGLGEVRFEYKNVQHRIIGFASGEMEFTLLATAIEKGGKFIPRDICKTAQTRKAKVIADGSRARDCDFE